MILKTESLDFFEQSLPHVDPEAKQQIIAELSACLSYKNYGDFLFKAREMHRKTLSPTQYDTCNVVLPYTDEVSKSYGLDYINASFILKNSGKTIIAAQLPRTMYFSRFNMFLDVSNTDLVVCLLSLERKRDYFSFYEIGTINKVVRDVETGRVVWQDVTYIFGGKKLRRLEFPAWEDMTAPRSKDFASFMAHFKSLEYTTLVVHCFAGIGRTGTFLLCYLANMFKMYSNDDLAVLMAYLRSCRPYMVLKKDQIKFCHHYAIKKLKSKAKKSSDSL